jgi:hypothetical protein
VASFRRYVAANLPEETRRSQVRVLRPFPAEPGEAQIDYGQLGRWLDPRTGKRVVICSRWCLPARGTCRAPGDQAGPARLDRVPPGGVLFLRRGPPRGWCPNMFRGTYSGFCARPGYVPEAGSESSIRASVAQITDAGHITLAAERGCFLNTPE